jgi:hypothetical protein
MLLMNVELLQTHAMFWPLQPLNWPGVANPAAQES